MQLNEWTGAEDNGKRKFVAVRNCEYTLTTGSRFFSLEMFINSDKVCLVYLPVNGNEKETWYIAVYVRKVKFGI